MIRGRWCRRRRSIPTVLDNATQREGVNNLSILFALLLSVVIPETVTTNDKYSFDRCYSLIALVIAKSSTTTAQRVGLNYVTILFGLPANTNISGNELWKFKLQLYLVNVCSLTTDCNNTSKYIVHYVIQLTLLKLQNNIVIYYRLIYILVKRTNRECVYKQNK